MVKFKNPEHILSMLEEIFSAINLVSDAPKLFQQVLDFCIRFTGATTGSLIIVNPDTRILEIKVARGLGANIDEKVKLKVGEGLTGWVAANKEPLLCNKVKEDTRYIPIKDYIQSELVVPLVYEEKVIGIISVDSSKLDAFSDNDLNFLTLIAPLLTQVVRNIELFDTLRIQYQRDEILLEINQAVLEASSLENALYKVLHILASSLQFIRGSIVLKHPQKELMNIVVGYGLSIEEKKRGSYKKGEGVVGKILQTGEPVIIKDLEKEKDFPDKTKSRTSFEGLSFIAYPIQYKKRVLGVIWYDKNYMHSASTIQSDLNLLEFVTSFLTQLLKNHPHESMDISTGVGAYSETVFDFYIHTSSPAVKQIIKSLGELSSSGFHVFISNISQYERRALAYYVYLHKASVNRPFLFFDAGLKRDHWDEIFSSKECLQKIAENNFLFIDNVHRLLPDYQELLALSVKKGGQLVVASPLAPSILLKEKEMIPLFMDVFCASFIFPPFEERKKDLNEYISEFISQINTLWKTEICGITPDAEKHLIQQVLSTPDPVMNLLFLINKISLLRQKGIITVKDIQYVLDETSLEDFPEYENALKNFKGYLSSILHSSEGDLYSTSLEFFEKILFDMVYRHSKGNKKKISQTLGLNRTTVYKKLNKYGFL